MQLSVSVEVQKLNQAIAAKQKLSGKTMLETVQRESGKLAFELSKELRSIQPKKGSIRQMQLARIHAGGGIRVSEWVKRRVMTKYNVRTSLTSRRQVGIVKSLKKQTKVIFGEGLWQKMVELELSSRESGRGFLSVSSVYPRTITANTFAKSRVGQKLSTVGLKPNTDGATATFTWDGNISAQAAGAAAGLTNEPKAQTAIAKALAATTADILVYVERKTGEDIAKAGLK